MAATSSGPDAMAAISGLRFDRCLPSGLAHRRALAEVFVTDSAALGKDEYALAVQIPRAHSLWFDRRVAYHDPLATLEASRQGMFVIVHRHLGIEPGPPFTLRRLDFRVQDLELFRDDGEPLEAVWVARLENRRTTAEIVVGMSLRGELLVGGEVAATLSGEIAMLPRRDYDLMRATQRARVDGAGRYQPPFGARVAPASIGRRDPRNVVVGGLEEVGELGRPARPLIVDESHPSFYDHPQDHVPGPLLIEGVKQAAALAAAEAGAWPGPDVALVGCAGTFSDFCEPDAPIWCSAEVAAGSGPEARVEVTVHQFGTAAVAARVGLREWP